MEIEAFLLPNIHMFSLKYRRWIGLFVCSSEKENILPG